MKKILSLVLTLWFCTCCAQNIAKTKKKIDVDYSIIMSINNDSTIKKIVNSFIFIVILLNLKFFICLTPSKFFFSSIQLTV